MKKTPLRMCVICRTKADKRDFIRIVLNKDETVTFDPTGKVSGRGAYLCRNEKCIMAELKAHKLSKGLRHPITEADYEHLAKELLAQCANEV